LLKQLSAFDVNEVDESVDYVESQENYQKRPSRKTPSMLLVQNSDVTIGSQVWIEDESEVWSEAEIIKQDNKSTITVRQTNNQVEIILDLSISEIHKVNPSVVADMTALNSIHEPGILQNLSMRYKVRSPYTYMGSVLIAVNPIRRLADIPFQEFEKNVSSNSPNDRPHPYALAGKYLQPSICNHSFITT